MQGDETALYIRRLVDTVNQLSARVADLEQQKLVASVQARTTKSQHYHHSEKFGAVVTFDNSVVYLQESRMMSGGSRWTKVASGTIYKTQRSDWQMRPIHGETVMLVASGNNHMLALGQQPSFAAQIISAIVPETQVTTAGTVSPIVTLPSAPDEIHNFYYVRLISGLPKATAASTMTVVATLFFSEYDFLEQHTEVVSVKLLAISPGQVVPPHTFVTVQRTYNSLYFGMPVYP